MSSKKHRDVFYVIINIAEMKEEFLNEEKKNFSTTGSWTNSTLRKNNIGGKIIVKIKDLKNTLFKSRRWYTHEEIIKELEKAEWN